mgnify:CR=1 FL=1
MRKSEKLSDAIGEISDDIIEEAYTYKPKHDMHQRKASFKWRAAAAVLAMLVLAGVGVSVGGGTSFFRLGTIVSRFTGKAAKVVYRIQGIPVTRQEIQAGVALRVENGETVKTAKKEVIKDIITKKTLYALAKKNGCTVSDQEYDDYAKLLKTQMNKAENRKKIRDFYAGFGGESAYWKNMEPVIRQNLAVRKYIDSQTGTQTEEEMLELRNITYEVEDNQDNKEILKDVSLTIDEHFVAITGPNGGGKSTLAKIIAGIIKPTSGQIILDGEDITELDITERAKHGISYAFQQPVHFKGLTVKDLITIAAGRTMTVNEICEILSEVGLCAREYIDREINGSLSGGELKRIEIAMITARGTKLSIFDEPEAGIDLWSFNSLIKVFEKMRDEIQGTILIISHQERILDIADKIVVIANGQVKTIGTKEEVLPELLHTAGACETLTSKL